jgi:hypothetical protein
MQLQTETQKNEWWQVYERIGEVLKEFIDWYIWRFNMPVDIEIRTDYVRLGIYWDTENETETCFHTCVNEARKEGVVEEIGEEKVEERCYDACCEDITVDTNNTFSEVRIKLHEVLDKYGFKYDWEEFWEGDTKYLNFLIKF